MKSSLRFLFALAITTLIHLFGTSSAAWAAKPKLPAGSILITNTTSSDFLSLGRSGKEKVWCHIRNSHQDALTTGFIRKDTRSGKSFWRSFDNYIRDAKKDRRLSASARNALVSNLKKRKTKFDLQCALAVITPTAAPTETPSPINSVTPTASASATATPVATSTTTPAATLTPTPTHTATPTSTISPSTRDIYIRCGSSSEYIDDEGRTWAGDSGLFSGTTQTFTSAAAIGGTLDDALYQTERNGTNFGYNIPVSNGTYDVVLHFAETFWTQAGQRAFDVALEGAPQLQNFDLFAQSGATNVAYAQEFSVTVNDGVLNISFLASVDRAKISGIEIHNEHGGHPYLHVVIAAQPYMVDYDGNGAETYHLDGAGSHTHQPGHSLTAFRWSEGTLQLGNTSVVDPSLAVGAHTINLQIEDSFTEPPTLTGSAELNVYAISSVGGTIADYFAAGATPLSTLIDALPTVPNYREVLTSFGLNANAANVGTSPYSGGIVVRIRGQVNFASAGTYQFVTEGGSLSRIFVDGTLASAPRALNAGPHSIEVRFAVANIEAIPARLRVGLDGGTPANLGLQTISHDETQLAPFINSMPSSGSTSGGETITIKGLGFFPANSVVVHWGATNLSGPMLTSISPGELSFVSPPRSAGNINVTVQTPKGTSNTKVYTYVAGAAVNFTGDAGSTVATLTAPTQAAWGPDGRLYVGSFSGIITAYTFNDNYVVTATQQITAISATSAPNILGISFNPFDPPSPVKIYVAHTQLFAHEGGACFSGSAAYVGRVSTLQGPNYNTVGSLITGLPTSNHDHGINGMQFDNYGDLLIAVGGTTNGGVYNCGPTCCNIGNIPESPFSAAVIKAYTSKPSFNGAITYTQTSTGQPNNDQVFGQEVDVAPGVDISVFTPGLRNVFDIVWSTRGLLYGNENGPNLTFGPFSTSATTQVTEQNDLDEVLLLTEGNYYGHPNRNRGRYNSRENIHRLTTQAPLLGRYTPPLGLLDASTNGIDEYRATTFNSAMRGDLLLQRFHFAPDPADLYRGKLSPDGHSLTNISILEADVSGLDVVSGPGGVLISTDYVNNALKVYKPIDTGAAPMQAYDIFPWRARASGGQNFVIGGVGFSGTTSVTIGNLSATITSVTPTRIKGVIPAQSTPTSAFLPVTVQSAGRTFTIPEAFRYVFASGTGRGTWSSGSSLPQELGEVAAGVVDGVMYIVGDGSPNTFAYNHYDGTWISNLAARPFIGDHHGAEVIGGKLYLIGGLGGGSERKLQVYSPQTNTWTSSNIPTSVDWGSPSTAVINGQLYIAGGVNGSVTHNQVMRFNPATNAWTTLAPMPLGRNHAASGTDGSRFYVFGGRDGGNVVAPGFTTVQIYNPSNNTWESSASAGSTIPPLPQARGGTGKAVYFNREFYVIGGETSSPSMQTYSRVDVYDPAAKSWRLDNPLPTARHGIFPLSFDGRIFVAAGGVQAGHSESDILEILNR